jgi:integrase
MKAKNKPELTQMPMPSGVPARWRKVYQGKRYYFRGDYATALKQWEIKKAELVLAETEKWRVDFQEWLSLCDYEEDKQQAQLLFDTHPWLGGRLDWKDILSKMTSSAARRGIMIQSYLFHQADTLITEQAKSEYKAGLNASKSMRLSELITKYMAMFTAKYHAGEKSPARVASLRVMTKHFLDTVGNIPVKSICSQTMQDYHTALMLEIADKKYKKSYGEAKRIASRQLIKWAYELEYLNALPRNWASKDLAIGLSDPKPIITFTNDQIAQLLNIADDHVKLYILLMLNTGMGKTDISDLQASQIDWENKRIKYKRGKTKRWKNVPIVDYVLWDCTFDLLEKLGNKQGTVLLRPNGKPLTIRTLDSCSCFILNAYECVARRAGLEELTSRHFRKTSATRLQKNPLHAQFDQHFLGHSKKTVAQIHYSAVYQEGFDLAIRWLQTELGVG